MSRLPYLRRNDLEEPGQTLWDALLQARGPDLMNGDGGLVGPFNAFVHAPAVGRRLAELGRTLRFETSIDRRLVETAIITVGAEWKAGFEWWAHAQMARDNGVADAVVEAIGSGAPPPFASPDERAVYALAQQLTRTGRVDDATYRDAHDYLGDAGLVELVALCGYYATVSYLLNAFQVPLPSGATVRWPGQTQHT